MPSNKKKRTSRYRPPRINILGGFLLVQIPLIACLAFQNTAVASTQTNPEKKIPYSSEFISQSVSPVMEPGKRYPVQIIFKNTGKTPWNTGLVFLGSQNPPQNNTWSIRQVGLLKSIRPGQTKSFDFEITAPTKSGTYNFQWQLFLKVGKNPQYFGQSSTNLLIKVNSPPLIMPLEDQTTYEHKPLQFQVLAQDPDNDSLTYSASNLPEGASFDSATQVFKWNPQHGQKGAYSNISLTVSDGINTLSKNTAITVLKTVVFGTIYTKDQFGQTIPLEGAAIDIMDIYRAQIIASGVTDFTGHFDVFYETWQDGTYIIRASKPGYKTYEGAATLRGNSMMPFSVTLFEGIPPTGTIKINDDTPYTNSTSVTLTLSAQDNDGGSGLSQMRFSNDNVNWSTPEAYATTNIWTLSEGDGEKAVYVKFKDVAGNWSQSYSDSIILDTTGSTVIGPEGGEITSQDGEIKVVIPPGALNEPRAIRLLPVNRETLEQAVPTDKALLSAVDCKPDALVFNSPISLVYTLPQAEIPGTITELGLYDSQQNKIIPTDETQVVHADGYTVSFPITHFSTYAALKGLISQGAPIGGGVKIPLPDMLTGAFGHSIPITIPQGRKGMQPNLAITYRSSGPNSWVGMGFSLNPGYIVRSTKSGLPTYDDTKDTFHYITDTGATELIHLIDNLYQAKIESSFAKFFKEQDDAWKAVNKDGSILRFGQTQESKEINSYGTFSWYLTKAQDPNGNYIEYEYIIDRGKSYLSRVDYTGNERGLSPSNSIEFLLEARQDVTSSYRSASEIVMGKRLKEIIVKVSGELVWRYNLEYEYSLDTGRLLLKSVTQYAGDGNSLPAQRFTYQKAR